MLFWSATKGLASACLLHALQEHALDLSARVVEFWPEFAPERQRADHARRSAFTSGWLAGSLRGGRGNGLRGGDRSTGRRAATLAAWEGHGYHPRTFGFLVDEILRRVTGGTLLREYWRSQFAEPLGLDVWIGVPPEIAPRVAPVFPARIAPPKDDVFYQAFLTTGSFTAQAFASPRGLHSASALNRPEALTVSYPAFGGVGTASGLAKFYGMLANGGASGGRRFFQPQKRCNGWQLRSRKARTACCSWIPHFPRASCAIPGAPDGRKTRSDLWTLPDRLWPARRRREASPLLIREHGLGLRLRDEPDGARRVAWTEIASSGRRALCGIGGRWSLKSSTLSAAFELRGNGKEENNSLPSPLSGPNFAPTKKY